jgi:hypothetical protein
MCEGIRRRQYASTPWGVLPEVSLYVVSTIQYNYNAVKAVCSKTPFHIVPMAVKQRIIMLTNADTIEWKGIFFTPTSRSISIILKRLLSVLLWYWYLCWRQKYSLSFVSICQHDSSHKVSVMRFSFSTASAVPPEIPRLVYICSEYPTLVYAWIFLVISDTKMHIPSPVDIRMSFCRRFWFSLNFERKQVHSAFDYQWKPRHNFYLFSNQSLLVVLSYIQI